MAEIFFSALFDLFSKLSLRISQLVNAIPTQIKNPVIDLAINRKVIATIIASRVENLRYNLAPGKSLALKNTILPWLVDSTLPINNGIPFCGVLMMGEIRNVSVCSLPVKEGEMSS